MHSHTLPLVALFAALGLAGCAGEPKWEKPGATASDIKRDKYWCTKTKREKFYKPGKAVVAGEPEKSVVLDHECMKKRGYTIAKN